MAHDQNRAGGASPRMTPGELTAYLDEVFPERDELWPPTHIDRLEVNEATLRMEFHSSLVRPGGTISGPAMFKLADYGIYVAILGMIGKVPLAVTTSLTINFLRKPLQRDLIADVRLLKLGKRLAVGDVLLRSDGSDAIVAQANGTYSIPPPDKR
jgi:uncharacterized protein (TIGR00369 family)